MKFESFKNARVVRSSWLDEGGRRLDCGPYMSGALEARDILKNLKARKDALKSLTQGYDGGIYNGPMFRRNYVDSPEYGVPFITSGSMLLADLSTLPLLRKKDAQSSRLSYLQLKPGTTLISCSGTIGRMTYVRPDMADMWSSQDVLKVVPDEAKIPPGYLYAFLSSKFGVPLVVSGTYGAIIPHIEPQHIAEIEIPRFDSGFENRIHGEIEIAANLRTQFQTKLNSATQSLFDYACIEDCPSHKWNQLESETGFAAFVSVAHSLRASNYSPKVKYLLNQIVAGGSLSLGEICVGGYLGTGARFKRIDCEPSEGVRLVGQKQGFWMRPEGRWIASRYAPTGIFASDESVLIASSGTLGENEVYCQPIFVTGRWLAYAYTQHFLRVVSGNNDFPGAYLYAFLRSEIAFRALRSMSTGSKQQEIHIDFVSRMPIPLLTSALRQEIAGLIREAFRDRDLADEAEDRAMHSIETAIELSS
jgi:hypothetical protein